jgi:hypothetical protein
VRQIGVLENRPDILCKLAARLGKGGTPSPAVRRCGAKNCAQGLDSEHQREVPSDSSCWGSGGIFRIFEGAPAGRRYAVWEMYGILGHPLSEQFGHADQVVGGHRDGCRQLLIVLAGTLRWALAAMPIRKTPEVRIPVAVMRLGRVV